MVYQQCLKRKSNLPEGADDLGLSLAVVNLHEDLVSLDLGEFGRVAHGFIAILFGVYHRRFVLLAVLAGVFVVGQVLWLDFKGHHRYI
jgi:hypothetical protein